MLGQVSSWSRGFLQVRISNLQHETGSTGGVPLALLEDDGVGDEKHVQQAVEHGHVKTDKKDDELAEEKLERSDQENAHPLAEWSLVEVLFRNVVLLAGLSAELLCSLGEDRGGVGLGHGERDQDPHNECHDQLDPVQPSPASGVRKETTNEGTD